MMKIVLDGWNWARLFILALSLSTAFSCTSSPKLDEDGGYFDEKTQTYKYVWVGRKVEADDPQGVTKPQEGIIQQVSGKIVGFPSPSSVNLMIPQRQTYQLLSQGVGKFSKDDKEKTIRFELKNVNPMMIAKGSRNFRTKWKKYVLSWMEQQLLNRECVITFSYESKANVFKGVITFNSSQKTVADPEKIRNFNLLMIEEGISHYIYDLSKLPPLHEAYKQAENSAKKGKKGLWRY